MPFIISEANSDDTTVLISDSNIDNLYAKASIIFSMFSQWFTAYRLALNNNKTNFMVFMPPRCNLVLDNNLNFDGHVVKRVDFVRYLGFYIDCKLNWDNYLAHVSNKVNRALGMLKR